MFLREKTKDLKEANICFSSENQMCFITRMHAQPFQDNKLKATEQTII